MNAHRFDDLFRALTASRRSLLSGGLAMASGWLGFAEIAARKKRKRKKKERKLKPNAFGCLNVGDACKNADQCCSGICEGKKGKRKCRAHDTGTCTQDAPGVCTAPNPKLTLCNNTTTCTCFGTTAGSTFCALLEVQCEDCRKDADCEALGHPPRTACAPISEGNCAGICESGMACMLPCGAELPEPPAP